MSISEIVVENAGKILGQAAIELSQSISSINQAYSCDNQGTSNKTRQDFESAIDSVIAKSNSNVNMTAPFLFHKFVKISE